jgi:hypothetical protein
MVGLFPFQQSLQVLDCAIRSIPELLAGFSSSLQPQLRVLR